MHGEVWTLDRPAPNLPPKLRDQVGFFFGVGLQASVGSHESSMIMGFGLVTPKGMEGFKNPNGSKYPWLILAWWRSCSEGKEYKMSNVAWQLEKCLRQNMSRHE